MTIRPTLAVPRVCRFALIILPALGLIGCSSSQSALRTTTPTTSAALAPEPVFTGGRVVAADDTSKAAFMTARPGDTLAAVPTQ